MSVNNEKQVIEPTIYVTGVKRYCRKTKTHSFKLPDLPIDKVDIETVKRDAQIIIKQEMKIADKCWVKLYKTTIQTYDDGTEMRVTPIFEAETIHLEN